MAKQIKEPGFAHLVLLGLMATFPPTRFLLNLHRKKIIDHSTIEEKPHHLTQIPVIYIHGFRGGDYTTKVMVDEALKQKGNPKFLKVTVDLFKNVTLEGTWTADENPVIQLIFQQKIVGVYAICYYLNYILPFLAKKYHFVKYNAVGHSLGAPSIIRTEMKSPKRKSSFPHLQKVALVAGPFDGVMFLGDIPNVNYLNRRGRPLLMNLSYLSMLLNRRKFPDNISVLNVYGNVEDETNTDKFISVVSAKSIRYILAPIVRRFSEVEVRGAAAEHSEMHDNPLVIGIVNSFIYSNK